MEKLLHLKEGTFEISPELQILKAGDYVAFVDANQIVEAAKKKAAQIEEDAKKAYEDEKKRGYDQGLEEGNQRISELMIDAVAKSVKNFEDFENDIINIVIQATKKILGELDEKQLISRVVRNALENVRNQKKVTLIINPSQVTVVKEQITNLLAEYPTINFIHIDSDARVKSGGCKLETEMGVVDASLEVQLEAIRKSLVKAIK